MRLYQKHPDAGIVSYDPIIDSGTTQATSATTTTTTMRAAAAFADDVLIGKILEIVAGTGGSPKDAVCITGNALTGDLLTHTPLNTAVDATSKYIITLETCLPLVHVAGVLNVNMTQMSGADPEDQVNAAADLANTDYDAATGTEIATVQADLDALTRTIAIVDTTIATLTTQVSFTLTAGPADDNAINGCMIMVTDQADATQMAWATIQDYGQATKLITLDADPAIFLMAATDLATISCYGVSAEFMNKAEILGAGNSGDKWRGN